MTESSDNFSIILFAVAKFPVYFIEALTCFSGGASPISAEEKCEEWESDDDALRVNKLNMFKIDLTSVRSSLSIKYPPWSNSLQTQVQEGLKISRLLCI